MSGPSPTQSSPVSGLTQRLRQPRSLVSLALFGLAIVVIVGFTLHGMSVDQSVADGDGGSATVDGGELLIELE